MVCLSVTGVVASAAMSEKETKKQVRAFCLLSGGLDSQLAVCVLRKQNVDVHAVVFDSPFFDTASAEKAAKALNVPLRIVDFTADILKILVKPPNGFGSCMNPCKDCHATMLKRAGELMVAEGFDFISTGEVLNQRPMSQNRSALGLVARLSGFEDYVVRPLSAQHLPETKPEREGLLDRPELLDFQGRQRRPQMELAETLGLKDYPSPAGGCKLTEPNYSGRLRDLLGHEGVGDLRLIELLRLGRHMRLPNGKKVVIGRDQEENAALLAASSPDDVVVSAVSIPGPTALLVNDANEADIRQVGMICAGYSGCDAGDKVVLKIAHQGESTERQVAAEAVETHRQWLL